MEKIEWLENSIIYYFEDSDDIFNNFFKSISKEGEIQEPLRLEMGYESCEVKFKNKFDTLLIKGKVFLRPIIEIKETVKKETVIEFEIPEEPEPTPIVIYTKKNNTVFANNTSLEEIVINFTVSEYFKEAYPDFAESEYEKEIALKPGENEVFSFIPNKITLIKVDDNNTFELEYKPTYYFTTVKAVKEFFIDLGIKLPEKTDEQYKEKIIEKSTFLKKKFGLTNIETKNYEMFPSFKRLTNIYCLQDIIALSFIQGEAVSGGVDAPTSSPSLSLGKFSTKDSDGSSSGSNNSNSSGFLPDIIANMVLVAEEDVRRSIFLESDKVYWFKKNGGVAND